MVNLINFATRSRILDLVSALTETSLVYSVMTLVIIALTLRPPLSGHGVPKSRASSMLALGDSYSSMSKRRTIVAITRKSSAYARLEMV
jgi:hypothetical protein